MRYHIVRLAGATAAVLVLAATAGAQGKSKEKDHGKQAAKVAAHDEHRVGTAVVHPDRDVYGNGAKVPPGLAKKPGQMPPGQYKKRYGTNEGADVLGGILRRRGYSVLRTVPAGDSRYVYYRMSDGSTRRVIVSPGTDRLTFSNLPASLLREVMAALY